MGFRALTRVSVPRRWCSQPSEGKKLESGAIINKGPSEATTSDMKVKVKGKAPKRDMWMLKGDRDAMAAYNVASETGGDKGFPYTTTGAREFDDPNSPDTYQNTVEKALGINNVPIVQAPVSAEKREKQNILRNRASSQKALDKLMGAEDGMVSIIHLDTLVIVEVIAANGRLTAGLVDQIVNATTQLHNMKNLKGVIFHIRGDFIGNPELNTSIGPQMALDASSVCQRASMEILNLPFITICVPDNRIGGVPLDLMNGCDFIFCNPATTFDFSAVKTSTIGFMGSVQRLVNRTSVRKAMLLLNSKDPLSAEESHRFGVVDRISAEPLESAQTFLTSFKNVHWKNLRKFKELVVSVEQLHGKFCFEQEQHHFRATWRQEEHLSACDQFNRCM